jgi:hypothetical protein
VTVSDGPGNDSISVASTTCTFDFGSIDLGSGAYVGGGNLLFSGKNANASTIAWDATSHVLTITLGQKSNNNAATVASSTPVYTASSAIKDSNSVGISNSPFTLATQQHF